MTTEEESNKVILVIGGGVAGLGAGKLLVDQGQFKVKVLEGADRIGGRVYSKEFGSSTVEMGAEWIHGEEGNVVFETINSIAPDLLNMTNSSEDKFWSDIGYTFATQTGMKMDPNLNKIITQFMNLIEDDPGQFAKNRQLSKAQVVAEYIRKFGQIDKNEDISRAVMNWIETYWNSYDCTDNWEETSYSGTTLDYVELPGIRNISWNAPATSSTFLKIILEGTKFQPTTPLALPPWIDLNKEVIKINSTLEENGRKIETVTVSCADGTTYVGHHVICTIPLGVLKRQQASLFTPPLPESKLRAIEYLGYGTVNKLYFEFETAWWSADFNGFNLLWIESPTPNRIGHMSRTELLEEKNGFPMWCRGLLNFHRVDSHPTALRSWLTGRAARVVETLTDDYVKNICMKVLRQFVNDAVPEPTHFLATKWSSNPFSRGTYSCRTVTSEQENVWASNLASPVQNSEGKPVVCFAGEATDINFYSSLHGAYASGLREANRIIEFYKKENI